MNERPFSSRALFAVVYTTSVSSVYFALGVVAHRANGLTPLVFLAAGLFFQLTAMTYAEGASLHPERGGSAVFARYAFNELVSFIAGWAIVLDYTILLAVAALTVPAYLAAFWAPLGHGAAQIVVAFGVIGFVAFDNLIGVNIRQLRRRIAITAADLALQAAVIVLGLVLVFHPHHLTESIHLGTAPTWSDLAFAFPIAVIAFTGLEAAASLAGEVTASVGQIKRLVIPGSAVIVLIYVGIAFVGISALPVHNGVSELGTSHIQAPVLGVVEAFRPVWVSDVLKYAVAIGGALGLGAAAASSMLGVSRVGYSLATNRQIPSAIGRLSGRWGTPFVVIGAASVAAAALVIPQDLELLVGIYAFGALLSFTIAHVSVIALRYREPTRARGLPVPLSVTVPRGRACRCPRWSARCWRVAGWSACWCSTPAPATSAGVAARRARPVCHLPQDPAQAAAAAGDDPGAGAATRGARARVRLDPGSDLRDTARRRHRPDRGAARGRDPRRRDGGGGRDRGDLGVRDAVVATARRAAAGCAD